MTLRISCSINGTTCAKVSAERYRTREEPIEVNFCQKGNLLYEQKLILCRLKSESCFSASCKMEAYAKDLPESFTDKLIVTIRIVQNALPTCHRYVYFVSQQQILHLLTSSLCSCSGEHRHRALKERKKVFHKTITAIWDYYIKKAPPFDTNCLLIRNCKLLIQQAICILFILIYLYVYFLFLPNRRTTFYISSCHLFCLPFVCHLQRLPFSELDLHNVLQTTIKPLQVPNELIARQFKCSFNSRSSFRSISVDDMQISCTLDGWRKCRRYIIFHCLNKRRNQHVMLALGINSKCDRSCSVFIQHVNVQYDL